MTSDSGRLLPRFVGSILLFSYILVAVPTAYSQCFHGDTDGSGTVDLADFAAFAACADVADGEPLPENCGPVDFDLDGDVDLLDFGGLQRVYQVTLGRLFDNREYEVGDRPRSVIIEDLDADGDFDLAVLNEGMGSISVVLNRGDGTFDNGDFYDTGYDPKSIAAGDLDNDRDVNLITTNQLDDEVSIFFNHGDGTFAKGVRFGIGRNPHSVAIGDLDGDSDLDLAVAVANLGGSNVSVSFNDGNGVFFDDVRYDTGFGPRSVVAGDLDADGDLAVANGSSDNVSILLNHGDGTFASGVLYAAGVDPRSLAIGDLDVDGDLDVVVANYTSDDVSEGV